MRSSTLQSLRQWVVCSLAVLASVAFAQGVTGSALTGKVSGPGGALQGVTVRITNLATGVTFTAVSTGTGVYTLDNIPPGGPYQLEASLEGYYPAKRAGLQMMLGQRLTLNLELRQFEAVEEEVTVVGKEITPLEDKGRTGASTVVARPPW
jgi:hypothetical protein